MSENRQKIDELFNLNNSFNSTHEQGAVFLTGHDEGSIHTTPNAYQMDRVFVIIAVGSLEEIEIYQQTIYDLV